jgi:hypothetical protein
MLQEFLPEATVLWQAHGDLTGMRRLAVAAEPARGAWQNELLLCSTTYQLCSPVCRELDTLEESRTEHTLAISLKRF